MSALKTIAYLSLMVPTMATLPRRGQPPREIFGQETVGYGSRSTAKAGSCVIAGSGSTVTADQGSVVVACGRSRVEANSGSVVYANTDSAVNAHQGACVYHRPRARVTENPEGGTVHPASTIAEPVQAVLPGEVGLSRLVMSYLFGDE